MNELIERYPEFMNWYWSWGIFTSGIIIFFLGFLFGVLWYKDRCEKRIRAEAFRLATTNTIDENKNSQ